MIYLVNRRIVKIGIRLNKLLRLRYLQILIYFKILDTRENITKSYTNVLRGILVGTAITSKQSEYKSEFMKSLVMGFGSLYYLINKTEAN